MYIRTVTLLISMAGHLNVLDLNVLYMDGCVHGWPYMNRYKENWLNLKSKV